MLSSAWLATAAALIGAHGAPQSETARGQALAKCEATYLKKDKSCRKAVGNFMCLQSALDRYAECRARADALGPGVSATPPAATALTDRRPR